MSAEKETNPILIPRSPEKGADSSTRKVEVWQTAADASALDAADRIMAFDESKPILSIDPDSGEQEIQYPSKSAGHEVFSPEGQAKLAAELAGFPLRGDKIYAIHKGKILEGTMGEFLSDEKMTYGAFVQEDGSAFGVFMDSLTTKSQAELAEAFGKQSILDQGHAELEAAEVEEPDPFSYEGKLARDVKAQKEAAERLKGLPEKMWLYGRHEVEVVSVTTIPSGEEQVTVYDPVSGDRSIVTRADLTAEAPTIQPSAAVVDVNDVPKAEQQPAKVEDDPFSKLSQADQDAVTEYRRAIKNKLDAESQGDYAGAGNYSGEIYQLGKNLPAGAKKFLKL